jgi:hypothetical protein
MADIEILEKRWNELLVNTGKPKSEKELKEYTEEVLSLSKEIAIERAKEHHVLTDELAEIGIKIITIWDLVNTKNKYPKAIPILIKHLQLDYSDKVKEGIVRALTVPEAKGLVAPLLIKEYLLLPNDKENLKWVIGNAVNITITKDEIAEIFPIVLNRENGLSRQMFVAALGKTKAENVKDILLQLISDDDKVIRDEAKKALRKIQ